MSIYAINKSGVKIPLPTLSSALGASFAGCEIHITSSYALTSSITFPKDRVVVRDSGGVFTGGSNLTLTFDGEFRDTVGGAVATGGLKVVYNGAMFNRPYVILVLGQSNARGFFSANGGDFTLDPNIYLWNTDSLLNPLTFGTQFNPATLDVAPLNVKNGDLYAQNLGYQIAREVRRKTDRPIYVVQLAKGGHAIEAFLPAATLTAQGWVKPPEDEDLSLYLFTGNPSPVQAALAKVPGSPTKFDLVAFHGGEANSLDYARLYAHKAWWLIAWLSNNLMDPDKTPVLMGELAQVSENADAYFRHRAALRRLALEYPSFRIVSSDGIPTIGSTNLHFSGPGIVAFGKRYAEMAFSGPVIDDIESRPIRFDVDSCLSDFTASVSPYPQDRAPVALGTQYVTAVKNDTLGWCWKVPANVGFVWYTRRLFRVPPDSAVKISYEVLVEAAGGAVDGRAAVYQFDKDMVAIGSLVFTPLSSPVTTAMGRTKVSITFGRRGVTADSMILDHCEYIAVGINLGVGGDDSEFFFNILDIDLQGEKTIGKPMAKTSSYVVTEADMGQSFTNLGATGIITFTLWPALAGMKTGSFMMVAPYSIYIDVANTTDRIGAGGAGKHLILNALYESVTLECLYDGYWGIVAASPGAAITYEP